MDFRGIPDIFKPKAKKSDEANTLFGQTALGNNVIYQGKYTNTLRYNFKFYNCRKAG